MRAKLTAIIPCKDEQLNIRPCIESFSSIADEILVADSGSTDRTMDIARQLGARIIEREYINSANFKNWAIPQASHSWILLVDADERVTEELAQEIKIKLAGKPPCDGYHIYRKNYFFGHPIKRSGWGTDKVIRLFKRDLSRYKDMRVHSEVVVSSGKVGFLKGKLEHYTYWNFRQIMEKYERYASWAAEDLRDQGRRAGFTHLTLVPLWRFIRQYLLQRGFLDGIPGLLVCLTSMYYVFLKYAKLWAMERGQPQPDPEREHKAG
jgi:glycosyltransferase involved in cell wall biosynthesis